jgi:hypothetical protein
MKYLIIILFVTGCCSKNTLITEKRPKSDCERLLLELGSMVKNSHGVLRIIDSKNLDISKYDNWEDEKLMVAAIPSDNRGKLYYEWLSMAEKLNTLNSCSKLTRVQIEQYLGEIYTVIPRSQTHIYALQYGPRCPVPEQGYATPENIWLECYNLHIKFDKNGKFLKAKRSDFGGNWQ